MILTKQDIHDLAKGTSFLGSGGGGDPYSVELRIIQALEEGGEIHLIDVADLDNEALVAPCGWMGAPTVGEEKHPNGNEALTGLRMLESLKGRKVDAILPSEIGGSNGLSPMLLAAAEGIPIVDADGMGRAFPEAQMVTYNIYGMSANPIILTDEKGNCVTMDTISAVDAERLGRQIAISMGGTCHVFDYACSGYEIKQHSVRGTISLAIGIGRAIRKARQDNIDPFQSFFNYLRSTSYYSHGGVLFDGRIIDVQRDTTGGFSVGTVVIEAFGDGEEQIRVEFQNENLRARIGDRLVGTVPDILTIMDRETAESITTEKLRYGQRVKLVGTSVPPILRTPEALAILGPQAFNYEEEYQPIEVLNGWL